MSAEMRAKLTLDAGQYKAEMKGAEKASLDAGQKASAAFQPAAQEMQKAGGAMKGAGQEIQKAGAGSQIASRAMSQLVIGLTGATAAAAGMRIGIAAYAASVQTAAAHQAALEGNIVASYQAQLKASDAVGQMAVAIPILGPAIKAALDTFGDREGIEKALANVAELDKRIKLLRSQSETDQRALELETARAAGASQADLRAIQGKAEDADVQKKITQYYEARRDIAQQIHEIEEQIRRRYDNTTLRGSMRSELHPKEVQWQETHRANIATLRKQQAEADEMLAKAKELALQKQANRETEIARLRAAEDERAATAAAKLGQAFDDAARKAGNIKVDLDISEAQRKLKSLGANISVTAAQAHAAGGWISGPSGTDRVPAWLTAGEFVVNRSAAQSHRGLLEALNSGRGSIGPAAARFAAGGPVGPNAGVSNDNRSYSITIGPAAPQSARDTAVQILSEIRRLERRGR